jgi:hypothetical protein
MRGPFKQPHQKRRTRFTTRRRPGSIGHIEKSEVMNGPRPDPVMVKQLEEAFIQKFQYLPDKDIYAEMKQHSAGSAEQFVLNNMLEDRRRKAEAAAREQFNKKHEQAERHHREAKHLAWGAAGISVVGALAAMLSAWFALHPPYPPVAPAPTPSVVVASPSPAPAPPVASAPNPVEYISCRQSKLDGDGAVRMTIRNNNGFPIRNISLRIVFMPASRSVSEPVYQFQWFVPELIQSGEDLEFTAMDASPNSNILASHSHDSTDEWFPKPEFTSAESMSK